MDLSAFQMQPLHGWEGGGEAVGKCHGPFVEHIVTLHLSSVELFRC